MPDLQKIGSIKASFEKMIYVGDHVRAVLLVCSQQQSRIEVMVEESTVMGLDVVVGDPLPASETTAGGSVYRPARPLDLTFDQMIKSRGLIPLRDVTVSLNEAFPAAARVLGATRLTALACSSFLVGMVCPGLHSIYRNLNLMTAAIDKRDYEGLYFRVEYSNQDYRFLRLAVSGAGWTGLVETNARPKPAAQADLASVAAHVTPGEFTGAIALIVGGSRGLGELVAKVLAVGGADVTVTYAVGEADAIRLQAQIVDFGGHCEVMRYDVREDAQEQFLHSSIRPTEVYYMATPHIFKRALAHFSAERLEEFLAFYVTGFTDLCRALRPRAGSNMAVFYPSSVFVDDRPTNMTEYTMAKAAGEILCADMQSFWKWRNILVRRLPRLPTDQTATLYDDESIDPIGVMLPIIRKLHASRNQ